MSLLDTASLIVTPNGYKEGKIYSVIPSDGSGDLSVTRATTATRVNSQGLVELVPYNLVQYSQDITNGVWEVQNGGGGASVTRTANYGLAPDGTMTADRLQLNKGTSGYAEMYQFPVATQIGAQYTFSAYVKSLSGNVTFLFGYNGSARELENATTEWTRITWTTTATGSQSGAAISLIDFYNPSTSSSVDLLVWGFQIEEGSVAKDYQKTETRLNIPRLDYSNGTCPSILVEPQRTNLLTYSENLTLWNQTNQIASRQLVANPLTGVNNATKITRASVGTDPYVGQIVSAGNGTYTFSVYLWTDAGQPTDTTLFMYNSAVSEVYTLDITLTTTPIRYEFDATFANTGGTITARIDLINSTDQYIYAYGAQLEAGSYPTSYIPTTSASVTRNADDIKKTGASSLIGQSEGTIFFDGVLLNKQNQYVNIFNTNKDVTNVSSWALFWDTTNWRIIFVLFKGNGTFDSSVYLVSSQNFYNTQRLKIAVRYKNGDTTMYINGVQQATSTNSYTINGTKSELFIAEPTVYFGYQDPTECNAAALWKQGLTNAQLATLTTI